MSSARRESIKSESSKSRTSGISNNNNPTFPTQAEQPTNDFPIFHQEDDSNIDRRSSHDTLKSQISSSLMSKSNKNRNQSTRLSSKFPSSFNDDVIEEDLRKSLFQSKNSSIRKSSLNSEKPLDSSIFLEDELRSVSDQFSEPVISFTSLISDNETLASDRHSLQEEILRKDRNSQELEMKLENLQRQLIEITNENKVLSQKLSSSNQSQYIDNEMRDKLLINVQNAKRMENEMKSLQYYVEALQKEVLRLKEEKSKSTDKIKNENPEEAINEIKVNRLKTQYESLQCEYVRKEKECEELTERMKSCLNECNETREKATNEALRKRADEMLKEIEENKIFIRELQHQVDMYREKFMKAQTKVEQQRLTLLNLEEKSKNLDQQVCNEIVKIKAKFQEKLSELCHYPQKYEESKCELNESKKKIKILENDLKTSLNALTHAKEELKRLEEKCDENLEMKYKQLECENEMMRKRFCSIKETKKCLEDKLCEMKKEHELTRQESTKIIEITKKCADQNRMTMNQHISGLEIELAQCRASTSIQLSEKEESIKKLRKELSELCEHFNFCQNQIKCMKSQVSHLSSQCSTGDN